MRDYLSAFKFDLGLRGPGLGCIIEHRFDLGTVHMWLLSKFGYFFFVAVWYRIAKSYQESKVEHEDYNQDTATNKEHLKDLFDGIDESAASWSTP